MDKKNIVLTTATSLAEHTSIRLPRRPYARIVQNFLVVWLDGNINEDDDDYQNTITKLRETVNTVNTFTNVDECANFISEIKAEKTFMISSGTLGRAIVPVIHDMVQIDTIYIFCGNKTHHEQWTQQWSKIKGIFIDIEPICEALKKAVQECDKNTISMSFVAANNDVTNENLDQLDRSFMYTQILKEILLTIDFDSQHVKEFIIYCREQFDGNTIELKNIEKFEKEYYLHTPIWWYTYQCFLYSMLNRTLRTMEVDLIIKLGFFIRDLHKHIIQLHSEQYTEHKKSIPFTVYRGQGLSQNDFDQLIKTKGGLLSFNNFLSTSKNRAVSLDFARETMEASGLIGIVFVMSVDPSICSSPFANVRDVSYYQAEEEILFSMHSIFRIGQLKQIGGNDRLWQVELALTSDHDPQLHALTERTRQETSPHKNGWYRLGRLLIKFGQFVKAQDVFEILLDQTSDDHEKANIYYMLGRVNRDQGKYAEALSYFENSIEIDKKTLSPNHPSLATSYDDLGATYRNMREYSKALSSHERAFEIRQIARPPNHPDLATSYCNMGSTYAHMDQQSKALSYFENALEIYRKSLPSNHPHLATNYNNMGKLLKEMGEYSKALSSHEKALEIQQKTLPPNHPQLAISYSSIGLVYSRMGEYSKALSFYQHAVDIGEHSLSANHPDLQAYKNNLEIIRNKL